MRLLGRCLLSVSFVGLAWTALIHASCLLGLGTTFGPRIEYFLLGAGISQLSAIFVGQRVGAVRGSPDYWKVALRGCPRWMKLCALGLFVYLPVSWLLAWVLTDSRGALELCAMSAACMAFYGVQATLYYSVGQVGVGFRRLRGGAPGAG